jgi:hypothetical protein
MKRDETIIALHFLRVTMTSEVIDQRKQTFDSWDSRTRQHRRRAP